MYNYSYYKEVNANIMHQNDLERSVRVNLSFSEYVKQKK